MAFVAQVWLLCVAAFLLGSAVTWLLFVRPLRTSAAAGSDPPTGPGIEAAASSPVQRTGSPPAAADPALMSLGVDIAPRPSPGLGARAGGALDLMGVARPGQATERSAIPRQAGPTDDPPPAR